MHTDQRNGKPRRSFGGHRIVAAFLIAAGASVLRTQSLAANPHPQSPALRSASAPSLAPQQPMTVENATDAALRQASAYQQALIDEQTAALDLTQARGALLPRVRSSSTATFNKPLHPGST